MDVKFVNEKSVVMSKGLDMKKFWTQNREIVIRFVALLLIIAILCGLSSALTARRINREWAEKAEIIKVQTEADVTARLRAEYGVAEMEAKKSLIEEEANDLAKMLYPMQYNTDEGLKSACWCAINRVESRNYPSTIHDVCAQEKQWMGWSEDNPIVKRLYDIAYEQLNLWHSGIHAVGTDYVFLEWNKKEIILRTEFNGDRGHFWYEEDWDK